MSGEPDPQPSRAERYHNFVGASGELIGIIWILGIALVVGVILCESPP